ncbi:MULTISPECIES: O-antigen ligase family protein [unclassified Microbacterium]|uniref:O-antigen ligase family protein n=1 Tax=unclassified Microbacterium TaxID=2609290 RepID=UPI001444964F|nr:MULTISPECIES: O-antigen ligase family protein [unclassified Microbacterium]
MAGAAIFAAITLCIGIAKFGVWRTMVFTSIVVSAVRSSSFNETFPETTWYVMQFAPVIIAAAAAAAAKPVRLRGSDRAVLASLFLLVLVAAGSSFVSSVPATTLAQSALLAAVFALLGITFSRRWSSAGVIRHDLTTVFAALLSLQFIGLLGAATASWAYDPDYGRYVGLFSNANYAGIASATGLTLGLYLLQNNRHVIATFSGMLVFTATMIMSGSRGALLATAVAVAVMFLMSRSRRVALTMAGIAAGVGAMIALFNPALVLAIQQFFLRDANADISSGRLAIYENVLELFATAPYFGIGYRTTELVADGLAAHNVYLSILVELGLVGAGTFLLLIISVVAASIRRGATNELIIPVVAIAVVELTESSVFGFGGPSALSAWIVILAFAANGRSFHDPGDLRGAELVAARTSSAAYRSREGIRA